MPVVVRDFSGSSAVSMIEAALGAAPGALHEGQYVCVGDVIDTDEQEGFLRGHGTHVVDGRLIATLCGVVERVNKLVFVRPLKTRYDAAQGDVVVGRVTEVLLYSGKKASSAALGNLDFVPRSVCITVFQVLIGWGP
eukprot:scaffold167605_cov21-Tisochrysis_lutea.AAC.2